MLIKYGDGKIDSIVKTSELTEEQKKKVSEKKDKLKKDN